MNLWNINKFNPSPIEYKLKIIHVEYFKEIIKM